MNASAAAVLKSLDAVLQTVFMPGKRSAPRDLDVRATGPQVRMVHQRRVFTGAGPWQAMLAAEHWCSQHGISIGPAIHGRPRALMRGDHNVPSWSNLAPEQRETLDGTMTAPHGWRNGPVIVRAITDGGLPY